MSRGQSLSLGNEKVLEMDGGDGHVTVRMYLAPARLEMVK